MENQPRESFQVTPQMMLDLYTGARWAQFVAIIGFIFCGIMFIFSILLSFVSRIIPTEEIGNFPRPLISVIYLICCVIALVPQIFLYKYSSNTIKAINEGDQTFIANAFMNLKRYFLTIGILFIIYFIFILILFILGLLTAVITSI
ncbi:MAG: hypothetical protein Q8862_11875 [Bacteroidota bacterium]|nr:hypothetical protein [Bacteroidota bacterium]MDP4205502.1 hypothetical protein [Bacteroidota bacterium]